MEQNNADPNLKNDMIYELIKQNKELQTALVEQSAALLEQNNKLVEINSKSSTLIQNTTNNTTNNIVINALNLCGPGYLSSRRHPTK